MYNDGYFPYFAHLIHPEDDEFIAYVPPGQGIERVRQVLTKDQLKSKKVPPFPIPAELKKTYKRIVVALKKGEDGILSPLKETPNQMFVVNQEDLNAPRIHEKVVKLTSLVESKNIDFSFQKPQQDPQRQAQQTFNRNEKITSLRGKVTDLINDLKGMKSLETQEFQLSNVIVDSSAFRSGRSSSRFRDWNPDIEAARRSGVTIRYSSRSNEVRCPELNISSRHLVGSRGYDGPRVQLISRGSVTSSGSGGAAYGASSNSTGTNTGYKNSSSSGKGGVVKK